MEKALALSRPYIVEALEMTLDDLNSRVVKKYIPVLKGKKITIDPVLAFMKDSGLTNYLLMRRCIYKTAVEEAIKVKGKKLIDVEKNILPPKVLRDDFSTLADFESYELLNVLEKVKVEFKKKYKAELEVEYDVKDGKISSLILTEVSYENPANFNIVGAIEFCGRDIPTVFNLVRKKVDHLWIISTINQYDFIGKLLKLVKQ